MANIRAEGLVTDADPKAPEKKREPIGKLRPIAAAAFIVAMGVTLAYAGLKDSEWWKEISETDLFRLWVESNNPGPDGAVTPPIEKPETPETPVKAQAEKPVEAGTQPEKPQVATTPATSQATPPSPKDGPSGPQESEHGPNGSDVEDKTKPVEPQTPKATFVSDDNYDAAKYNLLSLGADPVAIDEPTQEDIWGIEDAADDKGVTLSNEEAALALQNGGFVKDGVTYEIWEDRDNPGNFHLVKCDADHRLVGNVPNFDSNPVATPETDYGSESDQGLTPEEEAQEQENQERYNRAIEDEYRAMAPVDRLLEDLERSNPNYRGGYDDGDYESGYDDSSYTDDYPYDPSDRIRDDYYNSRARIEDDYNRGYRRSEEDYYRGA